VRGIKVSDPGSALLITTWTETGTFRQDSSRGGRIWWSPFTIQTAVTKGQAPPVEHTTQNSESLENNDKLFKIKVGGLVTSLLLYAPR
jgi:hypothetical protein